MRQQNTPPPWTVPWLLQIIAWYESIAKPSLSGLAIISSGTAVLGYASQFDHPDLGVYLRCVALGFALWLIARTFWAGAWTLPALETRNPLLVYALVAFLGFFAFAIPSSLGSLSANGGGISLSVTQQLEIDGLDNRRQDFALYVGEMTLVQAAVADRAAQARSLEADEIAGRGPTGVPGVGSVSNSFGSSSATYRAAANLIAGSLDRAQGHIDALDTILAELRDLQANPDLSAPAKAAQLNVLSGQAIAEMRALLALDPARTIRAAAASIAQGVPPRSQTNPQSRARIAEISAGMRTYAAQLQAEADRIEALAPGLPQQITQSPAERLIETMWRMPGLTMAAILFDLCGWIAVGFRVALYQALKAKQREERDGSGPTYVTLDDIERSDAFEDRLEASRKRREARKSPPKRGRPKGPGSTARKPRTSKRSDKGEDKSNG